MFDDVAEIQDRLAILVDRLDPDAMAGSAVRDMWQKLDRAEKLCAAGKTLLARRLAATHHGQTAGVKTAVEGLARRGGTTIGAARDAVDTSARLPGLPAVDGALRRGDLSAAQAVVISAAAAANPAEQARLVDLAARVSLPELREECARVRAAADPDPAASQRRVQAGRRLRRWIDGEGFWNLHAKGTPQAGAAFGVVLDALTDRIFHQARRGGRREPVEAYAFDALITLADLAADPPGPALGPGQSGRGAGPSGACTNNAVAGAAADGATVAAPPADAGAGGGDGRADPDAAGPAPGAARPGRVSPRFLGLLRVDVAALRRGRVAADELCEIRGVGPVPVPVAEGLLGRAVLKLVITRGVDVLNVTHLGRGPTAAQKVALAWASPGCTVEGCWRSRVETDHRKPWADTRHTRLDELDPLCRHHHDLKTRHRWALVPGHGKRPLVPPEDPRHPQQQNRRDRPRVRDPNPPRPP
jgi:hypothetical protein